MSLDQNLFTLRFSPSQTDPNVLDLVDPFGTTHYRKQCIPGPVYVVRLYDFVSESLLVTATAPSATSKVKILELRNPSLAVELRYTGTFTFKWTFQWEEHVFEWRREECFMIRKPDPPVLVAITKQPVGRLKSTTVQVLDYNLNRFDIEDRKGLEIVILTSLLTFIDSNEAQHAPKDEDSVNQRKVPWILSPFGSANTSRRTTSYSPSSSKDDRSRNQNTPGGRANPHIIYAPAFSPSDSHPAPRRRSESTPTPSSSSPSPTTDPMPSAMVHAVHTGSRSPRHHSHTHRSRQGGVNLIAEIQAYRLKIHEVTVYAEGVVGDYAIFCWRMLQDEALRFISIRSNTSAQVQKVLEIVEETKRLRYQIGPYIELQQYVLYDPLPEAPTRQRLEEKNELLSPKANTSKRKGKEARKRTKQNKNAKKGNTEDNLGKENRPEIEEYVVPPDSVSVHLTKVEVQTSASILPISNVKEHRAKKSNKNNKKSADDDNGKGKGTEPISPPDPRFLVQQPPSELIPLHTTRDKGKGKARADSSTPGTSQTWPSTNPRQTTSEVLAPPRLEDSQLSQGDHRRRPKVPRANRSAPDQVQHSELTVSQMFLKWSSPSEQSTHPPIRHDLTASGPALSEAVRARLDANLPPLPLASSSSSPELRTLTGLPQGQANTQKGAPPLPPRRTAGPAIFINDADVPVAGPSRVTEANQLQAPPSYTEMPSAGESPLDESVVVVEKDVR